LLDNQKSYKEIYAVAQKSKQYRERKLSPKLSKKWLLKYHFSFLKKNIYIISHTKVEYFVASNMIGCATCLKENKIPIENNIFNKIMKQINIQRT